MKKYGLDRAAHISKNDALFIGGMGLITALLLLPLLQNLGVSSLLSAHNLPFVPILFGFFVFMPVAFMSMAFFLLLLPFRDHSAAQLSRYAVIGAFNVALNASIFNLLILLTGISKGLWVTGFAVITFLIVVTQAFFWSVFWTFRNAPPRNRVDQYKHFLGVSSAVAFVNITIIHILVNVVGAPVGIPTPIWANIALLCTIVTAVLGNFIGYKYFVFRH